MFRFKILLNSSTVIAKYSTLWNKKEYGKLWFWFMLKNFPILHQMICNFDVDIDIYIIKYPKIKCKIYEFSKIQNSIVSRYLIIHPSATLFDNYICEKTLLFFLQFIIITYLYINITVLEKNMHHLRNLYFFSI